MAGCPNCGTDNPDRAKHRLECGASLGRFAELSVLCTEIRERAERIDWAAGPAMADRLDAARLLAEGDPARAAELAHSSVERFAAVGAEWEAAEVLAAAEPALRRAGGVAGLERLAALPI